MKYARRLLTLLLCLLLAANPWMAALSEGAPEAQVVQEAEAAEFDAAEVEAAEPEPAEAEAPELAPDAGEDFAELGPDAGEFADEPSDSAEAEGEIATIEAEPSADAPALLLPWAELFMGVGEARAIGAGFSDGGSYPIRYSSDNAQVVSVDGEGTLTALAEGMAKIALESEYGSAELAVTVGKKPTRVVISAPRNQMGAPEGGFEDSLRLKVSLEPEGAASLLSFTSNNPAVASVDGEGVVTAHRGGTITITVKTYNKKKASVRISVRKAPASVELSGCPAALGVGETGALAAALTKGSAGGVMFSSSAPDVLAVDPDTGVYEAVGVGSATLRAESYNGKFSALDVTVKRAPEALTLSPAEVTLGLNEYMPLPAVDLGEDCAGSYSFASEDSKRATILKDGRIRVRKAGDARITATSYNGKTATLLLHVVKAPSKLTLSAHHTTLGVGEELPPLGYALKPEDAASKISYSSGNAALATVDDSGVVRAVAPTPKGKPVKITASTFNKKRATVSLTVLPAPEGIELPAELALGQGEVYALQSKLLPEGSGGGIRYWVDDEAVASVDPDSGIITAKARGETVLHAETYNGLRGQCGLIVRGAPTGISLPDGEEISISVKDSYQLQAPVLAGEDVASGGFSYKSSNRNLPVSADGRITANRIGKYTVTVSTYNNLSAAIRVVVKGQPKSIAFLEESHQLFIDHAFTPELSFANEVPSSYALSSSDPAVAEIGADGHSVRGVSGGTAIITATAFNGKMATMEVWVPALPDSVALDPAEITLGAGDRAALRAVTPEGQGAEMAYSCNNSGVAELEQLDNETVAVIARALGSAEVTVRAQNGREGKARVTVRRAPTALNLNPPVAGRSLAEGQLQLSWSFGGEGEGGRVEFSSSNPAVATVDESGLVRFVGTGSAQITARTYNGHTAACALRVGSAPRAMRFDQQEYLVALGDTVRIPASFDGGCESYSLSAESSSILEASGETVHALALGSTTVYAVSRSGLNASCTVRVVPAPTGLALNQTEAELTAYTGEPLQLQATLSPDGVGSVRYASSAPEIAAVDGATGLVTPLGKGNCTIRAVSYNGRLSAECTVRVSLPLEGVKVGIDPGHQANGDMAREPKFPYGKGTKYRCAAPGSGVARVSEDKINLQIGLQLRDALVKLGASVVMTRETADVNISNRERALLMNDAHVDFALRLHCNASKASRASGVSIIGRKTCNYPETELDGAWVLGEEQRLAECLLPAYLAATGCKKRGIGKSDAYTMNNWAKVPCLLVEMGFMTNSTEGRLLVQPEYQIQIVTGLVNGICAYEGLPDPVGWQN